MEQTSLVDVVWQAGRHAQALSMLDELPLAEVLAGWEGAGA
jgi:hypothetical protein